MLMAEQLTMATNPTNGRQQRLKQLAGTAILALLASAILFSISEDNGGQNDWYANHNHEEIVRSRHRTLRADDGGHAIKLVDDAKLLELEISAIQSDGGNKKSHRKKKKRLALIRPYGPNDGNSLLQSFELWDTHWPCNLLLGDDVDDKYGVDDDSVSYDVDLVLSYSRKFELGAPSAGETEVEDDAFMIVEMIRNKFLEERTGWAACFADLRVIEANIHPSLDHYERHPVTGVPECITWVSGPNRQFRRSISEVMGVNPPPSSARSSNGGNGNGEDDANKEAGKKEPYYELAMLMEADHLPQRAGWLADILTEVQQETPFAILGSKYKGRSWDGIKEFMPASLVHHINGNAIYNLTNPLFHLVHEKLHHEGGTPFEAIPYDYRISQMIYEGQYGTRPEFPFPWMKHPETGEEFKLHKKPSLTTFWERNVAGEVGDLVKESKVMANFAESNYLPQDVGDEALVHGVNVYQPWNPDTHQISLVVSAWDDRCQHRAFLSQFHPSNTYKKKHPFQNIVIMENSCVEVFNEKPEMILDDAENDIIPETSVPVQVLERSGSSASALTDICDAPVSTEWFYHTDANFRVVDQVDLFFTFDYPISRPVVTYTPAESLHCSEYPACRETLRLAREIHPDLDKVVSDMDVLYHLPSRNAFCKYWERKYGESGEVLEAREGGKQLAHEKGIPLAPTATAYVAYLYHIGLAESIYKFSNVLVHGSRAVFVRVEEDAEELKEGEAPQSPTVERRLAKGAASPKPPKRRLAKKEGTGGGGGGEPTCASEGQGSKQCGARKKDSLGDVCCSDLVCEEGIIVCRVASTYGGGTARKLSLSRSGLLVEG